MKFTLSIRTASLVAASLILVLNTACSSTTDGSQKSSSLPVETSPSVASARVIKGDDKVYVTGRVKQTLGRPVTLASHVDVQLVGSNGQILAEIQDTISPMHPRIARLRNGQYPFTVSFPASEAAAARYVVVQYHSTAHGS